MPSESNAFLLREAGLFHFYHHHPGIVGSEQVFFEFPDETAANISDSICLGVSLADGKHYCVFVSRKTCESAGFKRLGGLECFDQD